MNYKQAIIAGPAAVVAACGVHVDLGPANVNAQQDPEDGALVCDCPAPPVLEAPRWTKLVEASCSGGVASFGQQPDPLTSVYRARYFDGTTWTDATLNADTDGTVWIRCPLATPQADYGATLWGQLAPATGAP